MKLEKSRKRTWVPSVFERCFLIRCNVQLLLLCEVIYRRFLEGLPHEPLRKSVKMGFVQKGPKGGCIFLYTFLCLEAPVGRAAEKGCF